MTRLHEDAAYHRRAAAHEVVELGVACAEQDLSELAVSPEFGQLRLEKVYITFDVPVSIHLDVLWTAQLSWKICCFASVFPTSQFGHARVGAVRAMSGKLGVEVGLVNELGRVADVLD